MTTTAELRALLVEAKPWLEASQDSLEADGNAVGFIKITELIARIASALADDSNGWISIDKLPPDGKFMGVHKDVKVIMILEWGVNLHAWQNITHWQPLPPLPKEET